MHVSGLPYVFRTSYLLKRSSVISNPGCQSGWQVFVNARLHVSGGALGGGRMVEDESSVAGSLLFQLLSTSI